jgi:hypothetical protein
LVRVARSVALIVSTSTLKPPRALHEYALADSGQRRSGEIMRGLECNHLIGRIARERGVEIREAADAHPLDHTDRLVAAIGRRLC